MGHHPHNEQHRIARRHGQLGGRRDNNKPQATDLGFHHAAGDENRTRSLSLGLTWGFTELRTEPFSEILINGLHVHEIASEQRVSL